MKRLLTLLLLLIALPIYALEVIAIHNRADHPFDSYRIIQWGVQAAPGGSKGLTFSWFAWNDSLQVREDTLSSIGVGGINWEMADTSRAALDSLPGYDMRWKYIWNGMILESLADSLIQ